MEQNDITLISDYLAGDLPEQEINDFEQRLNQDSEFQALFLKQKEQIQILRAIGRAKEKEFIRKEFNQYKKQNSRKRQLWLGSAIAAAIALVFMISQIPKQNEIPADQLALNYLEPYDFNFQRGEEIDNPTLSDSAFALYQYGDYQAAIPLLVRLQDSIPVDEKVSFCLAESYSQTGNYKQAITLFVDLSKGSSFQDVAQWKLALNHILSGNKAEGKVILEEISQKNHFRQIQADTLLKAISPE